MTVRKKSASGPTASMQKATPKPGSTVTLQIERSADFQYITVDTAGASGPVRGGAVELSLFRIGNRFVAQDYAYFIDDDGDLAMKSGTLSGGSSITETACLRLMPDVALDVATVLLRHCITRGLLKPEEVSARLKNDGLVG